MIFYHVNFFFFMVRGLELGVSHMFGKHSTTSYIPNSIVRFRDLKVSSWGRECPSLGWLIIATNKGLHNEYVFATHITNQS